MTRVPSPAAQDDKVVAARISTEPSGLIYAFSVSAKSMRPALIAGLTLPVTVCSGKLHPVLNAKADD